jgi:hypothetical protein
MGRVAHLLTDTITIAHQTGISSSGDPTFGTQSTIQARVEEIDRVTLGANQNESAATHKIATEDELLLSDRIWLPWDNPADNTQAKRPTNVVHARFPGETEGLYEVQV